MVLGTPFTQNPLNSAFFTKFNGINRNLMKSIGIYRNLMTFNGFQVFLRFLRSGWALAPQKHQYSYRNTYQRFQHGAARSPPGRSKSDFHQKSAKSRNFSIIPLK